MEKSAHIAQVPLEGDLDVTVVPRLRRVLDDLIDGGCRRIVINMAGCDYVDSAGMALIFCEVRRMRAVGGLVSLVNVGDRVMRALRICRLVDFVPVTGTGARGEVPRLDPKVVPDWRCTVPIDPCSLDQARSRFAQLVAAEIDPGRGIDFYRVRTYPYKHENLARKGARFSFVGGEGWEIQSFRRRISIGCRPNSK
jgi:anti-anti-sigma factor